MCECVVRTAASLKGCTVDTALETRNESEALACGSVLDAGAHARREECSWRTFVSFSPPDEEVFWEGNAMVSADEEGKIRTGAPTWSSRYHTCTYPEIEAPLPARPADEGFRGDRDRMRCTPHAARLDRYLARDVGPIHVVLLSVFLSTCTYLSYRR